MPSLFWRGVTVVSLFVYLWSDPALDNYFSARADCTYVTPNAFSLTTRVTDFGYDFEGRLTQVNTPEGVINYAYDLATGRLLSTCTANSYMDYTYDALGRLKTVHVAKRNGSPVNETTTYFYDAVGNRSEVDLPNGMVTTYLYDSLNRLTNLVHKFGTTNLATYSYKLDATGRRTNAVEVLRQEDNTSLTNTLTWQYDAMYRLTNEVNLSSTAVASYTNKFVYDIEGNRLKQIKIASTVTTITNLYDANDQLLREVTLDSGGTPIATNDYAYDANGSNIGRTNITSSGVTTNIYTYNLMNKLSSVISGTTTVANYQYNDQGIRVRSMTSGTSGRHYLIDANNHTGYQQILEEFSVASGTPTLAMSYVLGDDVLAQASASDLHASYLLYDGHGSTRQMVDSTMSVASKYNYDAYGVTQGNSYNVNGTSLQYCGEQFDTDLQMYNLRARYYSPANGRFNQRDTFAGINSDPQSLHKYAYCPDPINGIDPSGHFTLLELGIVITLLGVIAACTASIITTLGGSQSWANRCSGFSRAAFAIGTMLLFPHPVIIAAALDEAQAGVRQVFSGKKENTLVAESVLALGGTQQQADFVSASVQIVASLIGAGPALISKGSELLSFIKTFFVSEGGTVVLGRAVNASNPRYIEVAKALGANALKAPEWLYNVCTSNLLPKDFFWNIINKPFVERALARGDRILISSPVPAGPPAAGQGGAAFWNEIKLLWDRGFRPAAVGEMEQQAGVVAEMVPPS